MEGGGSGRKCLTGARGCIPLLSALPGVPVAVAERGGGMWWRVYFCGYEKVYAASSGTPGCPATVAGRARGGGGGVHSFHAWPEPLKTADPRSLQCRDEARRAEEAVRLRVREKCTWY